MRRDLITIMHQLRLLLLQVLQMLVVYGGLRWNTGGRQMQWIQHSLVGAVAQMRVDRAVRHIVRVGWHFHLFRWCCSRYVLLDLLCLLS